MVNRFMRLLWCNRGRHLYRTGTTGNADFDAWLAAQLIEDGCVYCGRQHEADDE